MDYGIQRVRTGRMSKTEVSDLNLNMLFFNECSGFQGLGF